MCIAWVLLIQIDTLYAERRRLSNQLMRDHMTGLFSRGFFEVRLQEAVNSLKRGNLSGICVCLFDVDDFKCVNDTFGHAVGDAVLKGIAEVTMASTRATDCAARLGGDEFAVLLPGVPRDPVAVAVVQRIRAGILELTFHFGSFRRG